MTECSNGYGVQDTSTAVKVEEASVKNFNQTTAELLTRANENIAVIACCLGLAENPYYPKGPESLIESAGLIRDQAVELRDVTSRLKDFVCGVMRNA